MKKDKDLYVVYLFVKPYVYRWLVRNYFVKWIGKVPVIAFPKRDEMYSIIHGFLSRNISTLEEAEYQPKTSKKVAIRISRSSFRNYGFYLSRSASTLLTEAFAKRCRNHMLQYVFFRMVLGHDLETILIAYQDQFRYTEEDWPIDSMKKICFRAGIMAQAKQYRKNILKHDISLR